ncbi:MAG TPA: hypothetical protein QGF95_05930 [Candidatus Latescibacteria bacterium]|jgi:hypothetical protein|nr:hypothetical protein [Gemmatimonadaceae bacterium]MDP6016118.1 hypothetical protein [Candidatus Latescibacterota bacterium]HJP30077.1 hypothetical protein [Candidatus Latescibacterota bacterium]|tara:strand:- start:454 stop:906 length:453 start_codon:yes stop_codon:yes gene_type:complete
MVLLLLGLTAVACGDGSTLGPRDPAALQTRLVVESAPDGLAEAVVVDTAFWNPVALLATGDDTVLEVEGPFSIVFRNTTQESLEMRYDLRFLDDGDFLVDRFIPFGQPVSLAAGQPQRQEGRFVIRSTRQIGRFGLVTMQIAVRLVRPEP